ncbi:IucA/IucC family protein [Krasilnikovia sp. MM14-A1004]|uniref:IucA/IucC family protein n=1 Tax=Krasilnikovia sp. MM14-A1004 TaxID=3373541 RepID=UPI00399D06CC
MTRSLAGARLAAAAAHAEAALAVHAPELVDGFLAALPGAADTVGRRLRGALVREGLAADAGGGRRHGFGRVEYDHAGAADPADLLPAGLPGNAAGFAAELRNAVVNLAIAEARAGAHPVTGDDPDAAALRLERLAVAGHNLHPCGRTRLGWDTTDVLAHDLEAGHTTVGFVAVRADAHSGDDLGAALAGAYPQLPAAPPGYRLQPVHPWQRDTVLPERHGDLLRAGAVRILDAELPAAPTAALRTLLLPPAADGRRHYAKVSLDIQVTSTRRSISVASTRNGPAIARLLAAMLTDDPDGHRLLLMAETAGAAVPAGSGRDVSAILRDGLTGRLAPGEQAVPGGALPQLVSGLVTASGLGPRGWLSAYARLLLPPLLRLTARGAALEAHLQNCLPTFVDGRPHRLAVRDFAGLRLHPGRLAAAGHTVTLWPGSVVATGEADVLRAKLGYTALQAHLGELIIRLGAAHGLDEDAAWREVRAVVDDTYAGLGDTRGGVARADHAAFTAPTMAHKALVRMRLHGDGDAYVPVSNPLHAHA